jgi:hypothetical protein
VYGRSRLQSKLFPLALCGLHSALENRLARLRLHRLEFLAESCEGAASARRRLFSSAVNTAAP